MDSSTGARARVEVFDLGYLDITGHQLGLSIGSIEGSGNVLLGANDLTVGTNGISTSFSGVISGSGFLAKVGSGVLTLQANDCIADTVGLILVSGSIIKLNFTGTPDVIASLTVNGVSQPPGIYGSPTSGAPHQLSQFAGPGTVRVSMLIPTGAPIVRTNPATNVANSSATLHGIVNPQGLTTTVYFQYGTTKTYGSTTASQTKTGITYQAVSANISGLRANSVYHFRMVARNAAGTRYGADKAFTFVPNDFNNDGHPDYLLFNPATRDTVIWYMNNNAHVTGNCGPTLYIDWAVAAVADFNLDGHPDYLLLNPTTRETGIWYMNNNVGVSVADGPALPAGWDVVAVADFNRDGYPDYLLFNSTTRATVIWYMNKNIHVTSNHGPTLPAGWILSGVADFSGNDHADYLLFNPTTRDTVIWYMNNNVHVTGNHGPTLPTGWSIVAP